MTPARLFLRSRPQPAVQPVRPWQRRSTRLALQGMSLRGPANNAAGHLASLLLLLQALHRQLIPLEVAARSGALSLLQLHHQLEGFQRQALVLQSLARQCVWRGGAAETAAGLLEATHDTVQGQMLLAASQGATCPHHLLAGCWGGMCGPAWAAMLPGALFEGCVLGMPLHCAGPA